MAGWAYASAHLLCNRLRKRRRWTWILRIPPSTLDTGRHTVFGFHDSVQNPKHKIQCCDLENKVNQTFKKDIYVRFLEASFELYPCAICLLNQLFLGYGISAISHLLVALMFLYKIFQKFALLAIWYVFASACFWCAYASCVSFKWLLWLWVQPCAFAEVMSCDLADCTVSRLLLSNILTKVWRGQFSTQPTELFYFTVIIFIIN